MARRWQIRPEGSNWGEFGDDDQIGRLNLITPERRLAAAQEVKTGLAFALSLPLDLPPASVMPPFRKPPELRETVGHNFPFEKLFGSEGAIDIGCDDSVTLNLQYSTQWDALAHVGAMFDVTGDGRPDPVFYNGFRGHEHIVGAADGAQPSAHRLGIEKQAETGVQGRGVLVDLFAAFGDEPRAVGVTDLQRVMAAQEVELECGDILCLHTGYAGAVFERGGDIDPVWLGSRFSALDGRDDALLDWITASGVAAIAADNIGVEMQNNPSSGAGHAVLPLHHHCLFKLGLPLGELWYLSELAGWLRQAGRTRFLLTAPPLRLPGAVGSPVTPVATV